MNIIAMDLGKFNSMFCFYDSVTQECSTSKAPTGRKYFESVLKSKQPDLVVVEACGPSCWVSDLCQELNLKIIVCSTHEDAWRMTEYSGSPIRYSLLAVVGRTVR